MPLKLLLAALAILPGATAFAAERSAEVEVTTLQGEMHRGLLVELTETELVLRQQEAPRSLRLEQVLDVRYPSASSSGGPAETAAGAPAGAQVGLADGSILSVSQFSLTGEKARLETPMCGTLSLPVARISWVRLGPASSRLEESWSNLQKRESKQDLLVVRNDDVLDFLSGAAGNVGDKIHFLLDGEEVPVAREKVYGLIFHRKTAAAPKAVCEIRLANADLLAATRVVLAGETIKARLVSGPEVSIPASALASLDFSAGKVAYLSQLEPRDVKYVPFFDLVLHEYRRDRSLDGAPLSLEGKSYKRGLAIHSKTTLRYRVGGDYTRFQAIAGIDDSVSRLERSVRLIISGDGKSLFDAEIKGGTRARPIELDVAGVRDFTIVVDFGADGNDIADHLDLAEARFLK
jgi:NPCBM/NEW2 domain